MCPKNYSFWGRKITDVNTSQHVWPTTQPGKYSLQICKSHCGSSASFDHIWQQEFFISRNQFLFPSDCWDYYKVDQNSQWELLKLVSVETEERGASYFLSFVHTSYMAPAWLFHPFFKFPPMRTKSDLEPTQLDEGGAWDKKGDVQNPMMSWYF